MTVNVSIEASERHTQIFRVRTTGVDLQNKCHC
jgi:hypothetical protein